MGKIAFVFDGKGTQYPGMGKEFFDDYYVIKQQLKVMDTTAVTLCMENNIDIVVFNMSDTNNLIRVINGENIGTIIRKEF